MVILICGVLHVILNFGAVNPGMIQAVQDFDAILVPVTVSVLFCNYRQESIAEVVYIGYSTNADNCQKCETPRGEIGTRAMFKFSGNFQTEF